jgi:hypothetical protein
LAGVAAGFTRGLKEEKNDRLGTGVGVGVGAAFSDNARPSRNTDIRQKILRLIIQLRILSKPSSIRAMLKAVCRLMSLTPDFSPVMKMVGQQKTV